MAIDVIAETMINRERADVAAYVENWVNDPIWIGGIVEAKMVTDPPLAKGTKVARTAMFLGKRTIRLRSSSTSQRHAWLCSPTGPSTCISHMSSRARVVGQ